jgi:RNA polymerase sigma factor FliA
LLSKLWNHYLATRCKETRNEIVKEYAGLVNHLVRRMIQQLPPGMSREDLVQFGLYGLIEAVERFNPNLGAKFETYASRRIKGAIIDQIRHTSKVNGGMTRSSMAKYKQLEGATRKLEGVLKRHPTSQEVADELAISVEEYYKLLGEISYKTQLSLDEMVGMDRNIATVEIIRDESGVEPEEHCLYEENNQLLAKAIDELPVKEKIVITLYYYEELTLKEIGEYLNLTTPRISQLHTQAMIRIRSKLVGGD